MESQPGEKLVLLVARRMLPQKCLGELLQRAPAALADEVVQAVARTPFTTGKTKQHEPYQRLRCLSLALWSWTLPSHR